MKKSETEEREITEKLQLQHEMWIRWKITAIVIKINLTEVTPRSLALNKYEDFCVSEPPLLRLITNRQLKEVLPGRSDSFQYTNKKNISAVQQLGWIEGFRLKSPVWRVFIWSQQVNWSRRPTNQTWTRATAENSYESRNAATVREMRDSRIATALPANGSMPDTEKSRFSIMRSFT